MACPGVGFRVSGLGTKDLLFSLTLGVLECRASGFRVQGVGLFGAFLGLVSRNDFNRRLGFRAVNQLALFSLYAPSKAEV